MFINLQAAYCSSHTNSNHAKNANAQRSKLPVKGSRDFDLSLDMTAELSVLETEREPSDLAFTNRSDKGEDTIQAKVININRSCLKSPSRRVKCPALLVIKVGRNMPD